MRFAELHEMAFPTAPLAKEKRLKAMFTPENMKEHYQLIINLLGAKYTFADLDELAATLNKTVMDTDEVKFQLGLIEKKLPKSAKNVKRIWDGTALMGNLATNYKKNGPTRFFVIGYQKGKWRVEFQVNDGGFVGKHKKFDNPEEALKHLTSMYDKLEANPDKW